MNPYFYLLKSFTYGWKQESCKLLRRLLTKDNSFLYETGWIDSALNGKPCDHEYEQIPWMNYQILIFLKERLKKNFDLFEFGSGFSTFFYAKKCKSVFSVEHNDEWYKQVSSTLPENASIIYKNEDIDGEYCRVIRQSDLFYDVVIVDGRDRVNCMKQSVDALSERGVILLDDSERDGYQEGIKFLVKCGFRLLNFEGLKPNKYRLSRSTLFYKDGNCFGI